MKKKLFYYAPLLVYLYLFQMQVTQKKQICWYLQPPLTTLL